MNPITGRLLDSHGPWPLLVAGCALLLGGTLAFVACDAETPLWVVTVLYGVRICGVACLQMPMTAYASKQLSGDDVAQGTAIITSIRQISSALLSSVLIGIMALASSGDLGIDAHGFGVAFSILAALTIAGFVFGAVFLPKPEESERATLREDCDYRLRAALHACVSHASALLACVLCVFVSCACALRACALHAFASVPAFRISASSLVQNGPRMWHC